MLADRGFSSYANLATLGARGVDAVMRLHPFRKVDWRAGKQSGPPRPARDVAERPMGRPARGRRNNGRNCPQNSRCDLVEIVVAVPGFRTQKLVLVTTLLDAATYRAAALGQLYFRRWAVELCFRDIKTTLGLDVLRWTARAPESLRLIGLPSGLVEA